MTADSRESIRAFLVGCGLSMVIWSSDFFLTDSIMNFTILYFVPIGFVTWISGKERGRMVALLSALMWISVYITQVNIMSSLQLATINILIKTSLFFITVHVLSEIEKSLRLEREMSRSDYLTGIDNRRSFMEILYRETGRARRNNLCMTIMYADIDNFKTVNDTLGHHIGDRLLSLTATAIKVHLRSMDTVARMGGG